MAEKSDLQQTAEFPQQLTLKSGVCSVDIKDPTDVVFKDKETGKTTKAHKSVLSQASPFFNTWFKEQWQKEKATTEYPVPGDIDWEVFTNVISFLYGKDIQFEEEPLPKIYNAADFLQLDNLKEVIVTSLATQWELKEPSIVGAMCTTIIKCTDLRVVSGLLYIVSKHYLIKNIQVMVENDDIDISPLPFDTVMEIAQSEEVAAPEIQLYHFLRKWAESNHHKVTLEQTQNLFRHVRYATIPHSELETITKYYANNNDKLWSAFSSCPSFDKSGEKVDVEQLTNRKCQEGVLLFNSPHQKKWTITIENELKLLHPSPFPIYTIVSKKRECTIVISWPMLLRNIMSWTEPSVHCEIHNVCTLGSSKTVLHIDIGSSKGRKEEEYRLSTAGLVIRTTPTEVRLELFDGTKQTTAVNCPHPWLLQIEVKTVGDCPYR